MSQPTSDDSTTSSTTPSEDVAKAAEEEWPLAAKTIHPPTTVPPTLLPIAGMVAIWSGIAGPSPGLETLSRMEELRLIESWNIIQNIMPQFASDMIELGGSRTLRKQACAEIQKGVAGARSDDTAALKCTIVEFLTPPTPTPAVVPAAPTAVPTAPPTESGTTNTPVPAVVIDPPLAPRGSKAGRGFNHRKTAEQLCPIRIAATTENYEHVLKGELTIKAKDMPRFLYAHSQVYDKNNMSEGLLQGHVLRSEIYQGPAAASQGAGFSRGKAGNAALNGITALTARDIAYAACQRRVWYLSIFIIPARFGRRRRRRLRDLRSPTDF
ncbi:hypothetical protein C8J57DRAFT_1243883 [Mycena rebaudengoi]|nr:hypothetical protein C8J57DRAFT_1243883 [Mycena rebaudengoi]